MKAHQKRFANTTRGLGEIIRARPVGIRGGSVSSTGGIRDVIASVPNVHGERREAAAAEIRLLSERIGCLPSAPPCCLGKKTR